MILIVGLGNPGIKYKKTRHNVGFLTIDNLQKINQLPPWHFEKKFDSEISQGKINQKKVTLAKPQTYMNNSGVAVKKLIRNLKLKIENLIVIHDDLDLVLGKFKLQKGRGSAGHKGVKSIIDALGTKDFWRLRIGIKPPFLKEKKREWVNKFVLENFTKEEEKIIQGVIKEAIKGLFSAF